MTRRILFVLASAVIASACGYRPITGSVPNGTVAIIIPTVENRTSFSGLSGPLTSALRRKTAEAGVRVESDGARAARLRAVILLVNGEAGMLKAEDKRLRPLDKIWRLEVEARIEDADGNVLVSKERFYASGRAFVPPRSHASEEAVAEERRAALLDDIADAVVRYMFLH